MIVRLEWRDFWFFPFFFALPVLAWFQACQFGRFAFGSHTPSPHSWERGHTHTKTRTTAPDSFLVAHRCISCPLVDRTIYGRCHPADLLTHCQEPGKGWYLTLVNNCFSFFFFLTEYPLHFADVIFQRHAVCRMLQLQLFQYLIDDEFQTCKCFSHHFCLRKCKSNAVDLLQKNKWQLSYLPQLCHFAAFQVSSWTNVSLHFPLI